MFIPIIITKIPNGKWGYLYMFTWLAFAFWLLYFVLLPCFSMNMTNDPRMVTIQNNVDAQMAGTFSFSNVGLILLVLGSALLVIYFVYKRYRLKPSP
jgi:uncharacterized RDD family membrane protein YckC